MTITVQELRTYLRHGFNILLQGRHGTGKTAMLMQACEAEGLRLKVLNAATLDPYTDLVGVPKFAKDEQDHDVLVSVRPHDIDNAEVIFIDELNRAGDPKTTNACFELIQFGTINGEKLPYLRCVVAAQNPPSNDTYDVQPLDPALVDRFHIMRDIKPQVSVSYLATHFDRPVAEALASWYNDRSIKRTAYISPRRMEMLGQVFMATRSKTALKDAFPPEGTFEVGKLYDMLVEATLSDEERAKLEAARAKTMQNLTQGGSSKPPGTMHRVYDDLAMGRIASPAQLRREGPQVLAQVLRDTHPNNKALPQAGLDKVKVRTLAVNALADQISPQKMMTVWAEPYTELTHGDVLWLIAPWSPSKKYQVRKQYYAAKPDTRKKMRALGKVL